MRWVLLAVEAAVAVNAVGGFLYAMGGAPGVPREWLAGSRFTDYRMPGWILLLAVGGSMTAAATVAVVGDERAAGLAAVGAGVVLAGWIAVQLAIVGRRSPLQPLMLAVAVLLVVLGLATAL